MSAGRDLLTGATAVVALAGLVAMLVLFGELRDVGGNQYSFTLRVNNARGLTAVSPVTLNGVPVGRIAGMTNATNPSDGVDIEVRINDGVDLPRDFDVFIDQSLVGDAVLELSASGSGVGSFVQEGETIETSAMNLLDQITARLEEPLGTLANTADNLNTLTTTYTELGGHITNLLEPRTLAEVEAGASPNVTSVIHRADRALGAADGWLSDKDLHDSTFRAVERLDSVLDELTETAVVWRSTAEGIDLRISEVTAEVRSSTARFDEAMRAVAGAADDLGAMAHAMSRSDGTIGKLLQDPGLYLSIHDAAIRAERALLEAELLIRKFRAEGVPIKF